LDAAPVSRQHLSQLQNGVETMPQYQIVFSSVVDAYIEADSLEHAQEIARDFHTAELDWSSNTEIESVEEAGE
jgi:hypothetical protein